MPAIVYDIDPTHSSAHFSVRHLMISNVKGEFTKVSGTVTYDPDDPKAAKVEATIDVASLHTRDEQRDGHLKSADFFDAANFPEIKFASTSVEADGNHEYLVKGDMTIHGVTAKINRKDFGLTWNSPLETGGVMVGDEIKISLEVELTRRPA